MSIEITKPGKNPLILETPVMPAAGTFGYGDVYKDLIEIDSIGAVVTNPVTYDGWSPAAGQRVIHLDAGVLVHTGLPNPGLNKVLKSYRETWKSLPVPVILHLVGTTEDHVRKSTARLDEETDIDAIELGLNDDITWQEAETLVKAAISRTEKPLLVRLPLHTVFELAQPVADAGAGALVVSAPPRGTARDPITKRLITGRIYGPLVKPIALRTVEQVVKLVQIPVIGCGGIHTPQDARDFIECGARAVQIDSVTWIRPQMLQIIGRDLGGWIVTRRSGSYDDEWYMGLGDSTWKREFGEEPTEKRHPRDVKK